VTPTVTASTQIADTHFRALKSAVGVTAGMALLYPLFLRSAYGSIHLLESTSSRASSVGLILAYIAAIALAFSVPVIAALSAMRLARLPAATANSLAWLRLSYLAFAAPPLYTAIGVFTYMAGVGDLDFTVWIFVWSTIVILAVYSPRDAPPIQAPQARNRLRRLHGVAALTVLLTFVIAHLANHVVALWTPELHGRVMKILEVFYRQELVEPLLIVAMILLVVSGLRMAWRYTAAPQDGFRVLQTLTGAYLAVFIASHLTAVFVMARWLGHIPTDWAFASGAPAGLIKDPWNERLIPHYAIGVWAVVTHVGLGVRGVMHAHGGSVRAGNLTAIIVTGFGAILSALITVALLGVHLGAS
jgi:hypothetical protein